MKHKFRGKNFSILRAETDAGGECTDPNGYPRKMTIPIEGASRYDLEVIIHEALHACLWDLDEEAVGEIAHDTSELLWRLDWRKQTPTQSPDPNLNQ